MFLLIYLLPLIKSYCEDKDLLFCDICSEGICTECVIGYSADTDPNSETYGTCLPCNVPNCLSCGADANICNECKEGSYLITDKESEFYGKCIACQPGCKHCTNANDCARCIHGYGLNENKKCVKCKLDDCYKCGRDYEFCEECTSFSGLSALNGTCMKCQVEHCLSCNANNALVCNKCEESYFINAGLCGKCSDSHCLKCPKGDVCTKCDSHYYLKDGKCAECIEHCEECEEHDCKGDPNCVQFDCTKCENGYYFSPRDGYKCVFTGILNCRDYEYPKEDGVYRCADCEDGYGLDENQTKCFKCDDPNCIMCDQGPEFCEFCSNYTFWQKGKCVSNCVDPNCQTCNPYNNADCIFCKDGWGLYTVAVDNDDYEEQYYDHRCKPCEVKNCIMCDINATTCGQCKPGYRVSDDYLRCEKCQSPNCNDCQTSVEFCDYCDDGFHLSQDRECIKCSPQNCHDCSDSSSVCFQCVEGFTFDLREGSSSYGKCVKCNVYKCKQCDFALEFCVECDDDYNLVGGHCLNADGIDESAMKKKGGGSKNKTGIIVGVVVGVLAAAAIAVVVVIVVKKKNGGGGSSFLLF